MELGQVPVPDGNTPPHPLPGRRGHYRRGVRGGPEGAVAAAGGTSIAGLRASFCSGGLPHGARRAGGDVASDGGGGGERGKAIHRWGPNRLVEARLMLCGRFQRSSRARPESPRCIR